MLSIVNDASQALRSMGPRKEYLADDCQFVAVSGRRSLRQVNTDGRSCLVPRQNIMFSDGSFTAASSRAWNDLPVVLSSYHTAPSPKHLKTHLFSTSASANL